MVTLLMTIEFRAADTPREGDPEWHAQQSVVTVHTQPVALSGSTRKGRKGSKAHNKPGSLYKT